MPRLHTHTASRLTPQPLLCPGSQWAADTFKSEKLEDAAEFGRIGRYYALEDMLTTDPSEKYGRTTLREHYERIATEGQEYDPYTSVFGNKQASEAFKK
jgi:hypothetical protein